jgi:molybdate transport system substrate-binding protein
VTGGRVRLSALIAPVLVALVLVAAMLVGTGCGAPTTTPGPSGTVTVLADASLTETFTQFGRDLETAYPGLTVTLTFAGSAALADQIHAGTSGDVYASASEATMRRVTGAGNADGESTAFARNQLVIAVPAGNPGRVASVADLARVRVALCVEPEPCGDAAAKLLNAANVAVTPAFREPDVKATLARVTGGEVDAALVYRTDVRAAEQSQVDTIEVVESVQAVDLDCIVVLKAAANRPAAQAFVAHVLSARGKAALGQSGFQEP